MGEGPARGWGGSGEGASEGGRRRGRPWRTRGSQRGAAARGWPTRVRGGDLAAPAGGRRTPHAPPPRSLGSGSCSDAT